MKWTAQEVERLAPILERIESDLGSFDGKDVLVPCSAAGELAVRFARRKTRGRVLGLELDDTSLAAEATAAARMRGSIICSCSPAR